MSKLESKILTLPIADSSTILRRRTFTLAQLRSDYRDAQTQLVVLLTQLHDERFTGSLQFNFSSGNVCNIELTESKKIPLDKS